MDYRTNAFSVAETISVFSKYLFLYFFDEKQGANS